MMIAALYISTALLIAPSIYLAAGWAGGGRARPPHRVSYAIVAALLWPLLAAGLVEFAAIAAVMGAVRTRRPEAPVGVAHPRLRLPVP